MPCMRLKRYWMQNDFKAVKIQNAKALLEKEFHIAQRLHQIQKERHEEQQKKPSLSSIIKDWFFKLF